MRTGLVTGENFKVYNGVLPYFGLKIMSVSDLLGQLSLYALDKDFDKIYSLGQSLLNAPNTKFDLQGFQSCVTRLVQNEATEHALKLIKMLQSNQSKQSIIPKNYLVVETLYLYFSLREDELFEKTLQLLDLSQLDLPVAKRAVLHLQAQQFYRLGLYNRALEVYRALSLDKDMTRYDGLDLVVNKTAALSQRRVLAAETSATEASSTEPLSEGDSYDLQFNQVFLELNERQFSRSLSSLYLAQEKAIAENSADDIYSYFVELGPIMLQIAYVHQLLGEHEKAVKALKKFYEQFESLLTDDKYSKNRTVDLLKLIYINNYYSLIFKTGVDSKAAHIALGPYEFGSSISRCNAQRLLLKEQYFKLRRTEAILNRAVHKSVSVSVLLNYGSQIGSEDLSSLVGSDIGDDNENYDLTVLGLACLSESQLNVLEELDPIVQEARLPKAFYQYVWARIGKLGNADVLSTKKTIAGALLAVQLLIDSSTDANVNSYLDSSIQMLEALLEASSAKELLVTKYFGVVALLTSLYDLTYIPGKAFARFQRVFEAVYEAYATGKVELNNKFQVNFLKKMGFELFNLNSVHGKEEKEANNQKIIEIFDKILEFNPDDKLCEMLKNQILGSASEDQKQYLTPVSELTKDLDVDALTTTGFEEFLSEFGNGSVSGHHFQKKSKRVRKKPQHPNKTAEPGKIDQERWLPMRDRTYYRVSKKEKKRKAVQGSQGDSGADHTTEESGILSTTQSHVSSKKNQKKKKGKKK